MALTYKGLQLLARVVFAMMELEYDLPLSLPLENLVSYSLDCRRIDHLVVMLNIRKSFDPSLFLVSWVVRML